MISTFRPLLIFVCLSSSSVVPLSLYANDGVRREQHTWNSSDCTFGDWRFGDSTRPTLLECTNKSDKKKHKFFLFKDYTKGRSWSAVRHENSQPTKFSLEGSKGTLEFFSSPLPISLLSFESDNLEVFVQAQHNSSTIPEATKTAVKNQISLDVNRHV